MSSQLDLDQGGTFRPRNRLWLGPSIGWIEAPSAILRITTGGTFNVQLGNAVIVISTTAAVTLNLPIFKGSGAGAGALPGQFAYPELLTILDTSGAPNVTINPGGSETISSLASISLTAANGAFVLQPDPVNGGSTIVS